MASALNIFWFRRDLRLHDNVGFYEALNVSLEVLPIFIFDTEIINHLPKNDARISFIYNTLNQINNYLKKHFGSGIIIFQGKPLEIFKNLVSDYAINSVYTNGDYEPYAKKRDNDIAKFLNEKGIEFKTFKDQVIFEKNEIVKSDGNPYVVYTPYMKQWKQRFRTLNVKEFHSENLLSNLTVGINLPTLTLDDLGFIRASQKLRTFQLNDVLISNYEQTRNFPAQESTSYLGPHLRFGTVSIRSIVNQAALATNEVFLQELIWREFYMQILWHFPETVSKSFKPKYDRIAWRNNEDEFKKWCLGETGYPLVDAGMRQLNATGFMHNRVRMLVGSFLCKHLLIDWRWGEAYFAEKLHDYEMASNVGNWQWVAGCGVDASPYFRIFNPSTQIEKFDKDLHYIKKWVPEFQDLSYPPPIIDHKEASERCLEVYKNALN